MKLVVGLGNDGERYRDTRHNVGYKVVDKLADSSWARLTKIGSDETVCYISSTKIKEESITLIKPVQGNMNTSGGPTIFVTNLFDIPASDVIVVYDDMDLDVGDVKIRPKAGSAHHNGIKSLVSTLGKGFARVRVGIGKPNRGDSLDYVLDRFTSAQETKMQEAYNEAAFAVEAIITHGLDFAVNHFNNK